MLKLVLDAGHGVHTPGKRVPDGSMREWHFNSSVVKRVIDILKNYEDVQILRVDDPSGNRDVSLIERTHKANKWGADAYVSVHANAYGKGFTSPNGIETFVYTSRPSGSVKLATNVQNRLVRETGRKNRGVKSANFAVLRETDMTAILCECGFMTNKEEARLLKSDSYRQKCAEAIVKGLEDTYKIKKKKSASKPKAKTSTSSNTLKHKIRKGDTFWDLSKEYKVSVDQLEKLNPKVNPKALQVGELITIKSTSSYYTVQKDDTLWGIAKAHKTSVAKIKSLNGLKSDLIHPGQRLRVK
ncbi:N-acetylmuramoyl-L-alanine amidase (plasmid) [Bacillus carboniphilus]|uniref:N-acetylmuramoyl-L-alanine amidase n=1 Tax=Bacillus carboniphilus TaxID=86663 RepID=A0ABY9K3K4_9BACI|nr:N-acetylmuramoyl-L-alanine amidase [Bacillus carboniphilus]WLR44491.1 N-acetylmuramoyl-L-alanine amidase [Bacillus carboniphilus]